MYCNRCGIKLHEDEKICYACGTLSPAHNSFSQKQNDISSKRTQKTISTIVFVSSLIIAAGLFITGGVVMASAAKGFFTGFFSAFKNELNYSLDPSPYSMIPGTPPDGSEGFSTPYGNTQPSGNAGTSEMPKGYEMVIDSYFSIISDGDPDRIIELLHPFVVTALESAGFLPNEYAREIDVHNENYGAFVMDHYIYGIFPYENSQYDYLCGFLGFEQAQLEQYISVEVGTNLNIDDKEDNWIYNFDLVKINGEWYIIEIW